VTIEWLMEPLYYASILSLLSVGITLSYMTTRVFNFAHVRFAMVAAYIAATVMLYLVEREHATLSMKTMKFAGLTYGVPLPGWIYAVGFIVAAIVGGLVSILQYYAVLKPLERRGLSPLALMISTLGFDFILVAFLFIYMSLSPIIRLSNKVSKLIGAVDFSSLSLDFTDTYFMVGGTMVRGCVIEAVILAVIVIAALAILIRGTKLGVMMRSSIENPNLALVLGINVDRVFAITWFIAGFIAGIAGFLMLFGTSYLKYITPTSPYDDIVVSVFAGSIVGGIYSVEGSIGGGFLIGLIEKLFVPWLAGVTGIASLIKYDKVFSMFVVALTLLFIPEGLASIRFRRSKS
jgi:branched-chain amino acid transport system permease protein